MYNETFTFTDVHVRFKLRTDGLNSCVLRPFPVETATSEGRLIVTSLDPPMPSLEPEMYLFIVGINRGLSTDWEQQ